jgi:hypothetical protein
MNLKWNSDGWSGDDPDTANWYLHDDEVWTGYSVSEWKFQGHYIAHVYVTSTASTRGYVTVGTATSLAEAKGIAVTALLTKTKEGSA